MISRESDLITTKQEESSNITSDGSKISKPSSSSTTSSWSRLKDPRVVRVSRAFGGKDRHSKVCTVRGLRDRRVRLSVPTAIQLYDLQDRLGLNQPSKVVDWLLNAAKHEIDELPPLQIPQGSLLTQNLQPYLDSQSAKQGLKINDTWGKSKDMFVGETSEHREENWARNEEFQENHDQGAYFSSNNFPSRQNNHPNLTPNLLNSGSISSGGGVPYNSFVRWDPSNLTLSQPQRSHGLNMAQPNFSLAHLQSTPVSGSHPFLVYPHGISTQNYFPSQMDSDFALKQLNFQSSSNSPIALSLVDSTSQPIRPFHFGMTADLLPRSEENDKGGEFH